jgi:hypothetical protein
MKNCLLFLALAAAAPAQQPLSSSQPPDEEALRARVQQFYQLQVDKKYRQAEALVAEDTKDWFYNSAKGNLLGFTIQKVDLKDNNTRAEVTIKAKSTMLMMGRGMMPYEMPAVSTWKVENGQWMWYLDPAVATRSPFGQLRTTPGGATPSGPPVLPGIVKIPDVSALERQVQIDRKSIVLTDAEPVQTATISNGMPGFVDVTMHSDKIAGVSVELDKSHIAAGGKGVIRFQKTGDGAAKGAVHVEVSPLGTIFDIQVEKK